MYRAGSSTSLLSCQAHNSLSGKVFYYTHFRGQKTEAQGYRCRSGHTMESRSGWRRWPLLCPPTTVSGKCPRGAPDPPDIHGLGSVSSLLSGCRRTLPWPFLR